MDPVAFEAYLDDDSRRRRAVPGSARGTAGRRRLRRPDLDLAAARRRPRRPTSGPRRAAAGGPAPPRPPSRSCSTAPTLHEAGLLDAAAIAAELGGLSPVGAHAADLAAEAAHRALGVAVAERRPGPILSPPDDGGERVLVAVSGGVDSAVAALREREGGADVIAVTLELWSDPANDGERSCCSADAVRAARAVAQAQGIPHLTVDLRDAFTAPGSSSRSSPATRPG